MKEKRLASKSLPEGAFPKCDPQMMRRKLTPKGHGCDYSNLVFPSSMCYNILPYCNTQFTLPAFYQIAKHLSVQNVCKQGSCKAKSEQITTPVKHCGLSIYSTTQYVYLFPSYTRLFWRTAVYARQSHPLLYK